MLVQSELFPDPLGPMANVGLDPCVANNTMNFLEGADKHIACGAENASHLAGLMIVIHVTTPTMDG